MERNSKQRIEFIDLAKGVCILLVVMGHSGFPLDIPGWSIVRMPLYFMLSGLFFKDYGGWWQFIIKKTNKILIPFLFFYLLGNVCFYLIKYFKPELLITDARGIWDLFDNRQFFNGPIWFLLALYWCNVFFCGITLHVKNEAAQFVVVCLLGIVGWFLGYKGWFVPLFIDVALTAMPFFTMGYFLKKTSILYPNRYDKYNWLLFAGFWAISFLIEKTAHFRLSLHYNAIEGWATYLLSFTSVLSVLFICKAIKHVPFITYMGRYSIIMLCVHHMIYRPLMVVMRPLHLGELSDFAVAVTTVLISALCIPIFRKYLPWFVAQKDLIK